MMKRSIMSMGNRINLKIDDMPKISRLELSYKLYDILDRVEKESIGSIITDGSNNDLLLCPFAWFEPYRNSEFDHIIIAAVRYAIGRKTYVPKIVCNFTLKYMSMLDDKAIDVIIKDIEKELRYYKADLPNQKLWFDLKMKKNYGIRKDSGSKCQ